MMPRRPVGSFGLVVLAVAGLIACGPVRPDAERAAQVRLTPPSVPHDQPSTHVVIRLKERRLDLMGDDATTPVESFPIAVGRAGHETPTGRFQVEEMLEHPDFFKFDPKDPLRVLERIPPGPANPLGERWIGFAHGEGWTWTVGIHGTPHPELLGRAVSGGCIRMRNADVIRIYDRVRLGTTVVVHP